MAEYIDAIRARIGSDLLLLPTTALIVLDGHDRILLQRRSDSGEWSCPGGVLDLGETVRESAERELKEETGLDAGRLELFGVFAGPEFRAEYPNGDRTAVVQTVFVVRDARGAPRCDEESTELRWFAHDALPSAMPRSHAGFLRHLGPWLRGEITLPIVP